MNREELFLAIGQVESSRLLRSELTVGVPSTGEPEEEQGRKRINVGRIIRNLLVAAIIISMLGVTAYAVAGFVIYDSPEEMISAVFGDKTGFDHKGITTGTDPEKPGSSYTIPAYDRVPAESEVVEDVAPYVSAVGRTMTFHGVTLTVDAYLYDSKTQCGVVTYLLDYPEGIPEYGVSEDGRCELLGEPVVKVNINHYGWGYIIPEKTTDTVLALRYYFKYDTWRDEELYLQMHYQAPGTDFSSLDQQCSEEVRAEYTREEAIAAAIEYAGEEDFESFAGMFQGYKEDWRGEAAYSLLRDKRIQELWDDGEDSEKINLDISRSSELGSVSLGNGGAFVSPISLQVEAKKLEFLLRVPETYPGVEIMPELTMVDVKYCSIRFDDGTEYVMKDEGVENMMFWRCFPSNDARREDFEKLQENTQMTIMFNRIIDIDKVSAVIINGTEISRD